MRTLDQPFTLRVDLTSPSLGAQVFLAEGQHPVPSVVWQPCPVVTPPPDLMILQLQQLQLEVIALRADLADRTWQASCQRLLALGRRLWHRLSAWRIRSRVIRAPTDW